jgi:hypothetical protein
MGYPEAMSLGISVVPDFIRQHQNVVAAFLSSAAETPKRAPHRARAAARLAAAIATIQATYGALEATPNPTSVQEQQAFCTFFGRMMSEILGLDNASAGAVLRHLSSE